MKSKLINLAALAAAVTVVLAASPNLKGAQFRDVRELFGSGRTPSAPVAVAGHLFNQPPNGDILEVFVRGNGDGIWVNAFFHSGFGGWLLVPGGGLTPSEPAAVVHNGTLKLFVRGLGNGIWENDGNGWFPVPGGGLTLAGPSALVDRGILKLFVTGLDQHIWENDFNGMGWSITFNGALPSPSDQLTPLKPAAVEIFPSVPLVATPLVYWTTGDGRIFQRGF